MRTGTRTATCSACQGWRTSRRVARAPGRARRGLSRAPTMRAARTRGCSVCSTVSADTRAIGRTPFCIRIDIRRDTWPLARVATSPAAA